MASLTGRSVLQKLQTRLRGFKVLFGVDFLSVINTCVFLLAAITSVRSAILPLYKYILKTFLVSVLIPEQDVMYGEMLRWMNDFQFLRKDFRSMKVASPNDSMLYDDVQQIETSLKHPSKKIQSTNDSQTGNAPIVHMQPYQGTHTFIFERRLMRFKHESPTSDGTSRVVGGPRKSHIEIECMSTSLNPIRKLLADARSHSRKVSISLTSVWRPIRQGRDIVWWKKVASRPARDITTVIIDKQKKQSLLDDIEEYLKHHTRHWYANHGIPYRRGYLFSGPPGTGKTSLASALAGVFGVDIYVLSLQDPSLNESVFLKLLSEVPPRCIILLEDIDVIGVARIPLLGSESPTEQGNEHRSSIQSCPISLSCLLNAIDGVSSPEGRILIMSTNVPDSIDRALTRPGRIDFHMRFELPSQEQLSDLFLSVYGDIVRNKIAGDASQAEPDYKRTNSVADNCNLVSGPRLDELAKRFASEMPSNRFSIADAQGFLLKYKQRPEAACEDVAGWVGQNQRQDRP